MLNPLSKTIFLILLLQLNGTLLYKLLEKRKQSGGGLNLNVISGELYRNTTMRAFHRIEHMLVECKVGFIDFVGLI